MTFIRHIKQYSVKEAINIALKRVLDKYFIWLPDAVYLWLKFYLNMGYVLRLRWPRTFSEKLQWLKLHDRNPHYTDLVDKYAVKEYVSKTIGSEYVIPTLGAWNRPEEIEWNRLPNQFVLKTTHGGGSMGVVICKDKRCFDKKEAIKRLNISLAQDLYKYCREFPYKNVPRRIIAEEYIQVDPVLNDLPDYKFFCFNGEVKALFVGTERQKEGEDVKFDFFDADFNHLPFKQGHENATIPPPNPKTLS